MSVERRQTVRRQTSEGCIPERKRVQAPYGAQVQGAVGASPLAPQVRPGIGSAFRAGSEGSYKVPLHWRGTAPRRHLIYCARRALPPPFEPSEPSRRRRVPRAPPPPSEPFEPWPLSGLYIAASAAAITLSGTAAVKLKNPPAPRPVHLKNLFHNPSIQPAAAVSR